MIYSSEQLKKLQKVEVEIVSEVIRICNKFNLDYFTVGGTTLGAIRHNGFIPWDDDIDIGLIRTDYDKFIKVAPNELRKEFVLQHYETEKATPTYHAKVMKKGTIFLEGYARNIDIEHGIFVDIMPFDKVPDDELLLSKYRKKVKLWHQLFIAKSTCKTSITNGKKKYIYTFIRTLLHIVSLPVSKEKIYRKLQSEITKFDNYETDYLSSRGLAVFECNKKDLFPTVDHTFETIVVKIPNNADLILKKQYGDYMKLPPEDKRIGHAPYKLDVGEEE